MTEDKTCAERIAAQLADRAEYLGELFERTDTEDPAESYNRFGDNTDPQEELWELPLSVEVVRTIKVLLSTGGPADGLTIELDADGNVSTVRYWFADWFDHAETKVDQDSPLWRYAEDIAETMHGVDQ